MTGVQPCLLAPGWPAGASRAWRCGAHPAESVIVQCGSCWHRTTLHFSFDRDKSGDFTEAGRGSPAACSLTSAGVGPASSEPWEPWAGAGVWSCFCSLLEAPLARGPGCRGLFVGEHLDTSLAVHEPVMTVGGGAQCPGHLGPHCWALVIISLLGACEETIGAYLSVIDSAEAPLGAGPVLGGEGAGASSGRALTTFILAPPGPLPLSSASRQAPSAERPASMPPGG